MAHSQTEGGRRDVAGLRLIRSLLADVALLARREAELATIELREKGSSLGVAAGLLAAGAALALFAFACLISAAVLALAIVLPAWAAALAVAAALLVVAAALALIGRARLRERLARANSNPRDRAGGYRMDPTRDRPAEDRRVVEIRLEIELAKVRIVETIDALEHKADVSARLADALSATASNVTARVLQRMSPSRTSGASETVGEETMLAEPPNNDA